MFCCRYRNRLDIMFSSSYLLQTLIIYYFAFQTFSYNNQVVWFPDTPNILLCFPNTIKNKQKFRLIRYDYGWYRLLKPIVLIIWQSGMGFWQQFDRYFNSRRFLMSASENPNPRNITFYYLMKLGIIVHFSATWPMHCAMGNSRPTSTQIALMESRYRQQIHRTWW